MITARTIEVLREERARLISGIERIDAVLEVAGVSNGETRRIRHDQPTGRRSGRERKYDWDRGSIMYETEGASVRAIADELGCSQGAVKNAKQRDGWRRRAVAQTAVTCPSCDHETGEDPCENCHISLPTAVNQHLVKSKISHKPAIRAVPK